jgi:hypothetical protein
VINIFAAGRGLPQHGGVRPPAVDQRSIDERIIVVSDTTLGVTVQAPGSARLVLAGNVVHLDPAPAVFAAMLAGWRRQQSARFLREKGTIAPRLQLIRRLVEFSLDPWMGFLGGWRAGGVPTTGFRVASSCWSTQPFHCCSWS